MNVNEIYEFLLNSSWNSWEINEEYKVDFIQTDAEGFDIALIKDGMMLSKHHFEKNNLQITGLETDTLRFTYMTSIVQPNLFIFILSDVRIFVTLHGLYSFMLRKFEVTTYDCVQSLF